jgi:hypothetical protein
LAFCFARIASGSSFSELFIPYRSSRPHSLICPKAFGAGAQIEGEEVRRSEINDKWIFKNDEAPAFAELRRGKARLRLNTASQAKFPSQAEFVNLEINST